MLIKPQRYLSEASSPALIAKLRAIAEVKVM